VSRPPAVRRACVAGFLLLLAAVPGCTFLQVLGGVAIGQAALIAASTPLVSKHFYNGQPYQPAGFRDLLEADPAHRVPVFLAAVEANDAGYFADPHQVSSILDTLDTLAHHYNLTMVVYAHGWRHNSSEGDQDFANFERTLRALNLIVRVPKDTTSSVLAGDHHLPRAVVGVYLGWKGKSMFEWPDAWGAVKGVLSGHVYTTFWSRKAAAERAGQADLRRFVLALAALRQSWTRTADEYNSNSLNFVGHSFGGDLLLCALRDQLEEALIEREVTDTGHPAASMRRMPNDPAGRGNRLPHRVPTTFGNIILINPAVESAQLRDIYEASRLDTFPNGQPPLVSIFSAENDGARAVLFPIGTELTNNGVHFARGQHRLATQALGSGREFVTDSLRLVVHDPESVRWARQPIGAPEVLAGGVRAAPRGSNWVPEDVTIDNGKIQLLARDGVRRPKVAVIARVDKQVIDNHSGFWRNGFMQWLVSYVVALDLEQRRPGAASAK